ncbi:uncharacterized protein LOC124807726 [Hydra vulgaris]|uniref:uncharacterized protein LOC124807726 n=1 Tax=Hydra vulgaris TaxID=6087 RepID=UPI001F5F50FB|nr:uncharacterized protein LOC124807726 [Hydra vulgaris]
MLRQNLLEVATKDGKTAERVAATVIPNKTQSPHGTVCFSQGLGRNLPVTLCINTDLQGKENFFPPTSTLSGQQLLQVQNQTGLSNRGMNKLVSTLDQITPHCLVENNFREKFESLGKHFSGLFVTCHIMDTIKTDSHESKTLLVHCKDLISLKNTVIQIRVPQSNELIKIGIDGGVGFLKVSLGIIALDAQSVSQPSKKPLFKDLGVKRQLLVAVSENLPEKYGNVKQILDKLCLERMSFVLSCDMKLAHLWFTVLLQCKSLYLV